MFDLYKLSKADLDAAIRTVWTADFAEQAGDNRALFVLKNSRTVMNAVYAHLVAERHLNSEELASYLAARIITADLDPDLRLTAEPAADGGTDFWFDAEKLPIHILELWYNVNVRHTILIMDDNQQRTVTGLSQTRQAVLSSMQGN